MPETLLSTSAVLLYGRKVLDLQLVQEATAPNPGTIDTHPQGLGANEFLRKQLDEEAERPAPTLARIYAFSYDGHYYDLPSPAIFLVHGDGDLAETRATTNTRQSVAPESANKTGVATQAYSFSEDMKVWSYDKGDFSLRMDVETGTLEQILLGLQARSQYYSGADARVRGADVRGADVRGADVRGADVRARGNRRD